MPKINDERTHSVRTIEFGIGVEGKLGASLSLNRDNQTGEHSVTACLSGGATVGEVYVRMATESRVVGGIADTLAAPAGVSVNGFVGLGAYPGIGPAFAAGFSYDPLGDDFNFQSSKSEESSTIGLGFGADVSAFGCIEINTEGLLRGLGSALDSLRGSNDKTDDSVQRDYEHLLDPKAVKDFFDRQKESLKTMDSTNEPRGKGKEGRESEVGTLADKGVGESRGAGDRRESRLSD